MADFAAKPETSRSIAGSFRQTQIILWKNLLLTRRNVVGTVFEILLSILFMAILLLMLYFPTISFYNDNSSRPQDVIDQFNPYFMNYKLTGNFLYHPNTPLARDLTYRALKMINGSYGQISVNGDGCGSSPTPFFNCLRLNGSLDFVESASFLIPEKKLINMFSSFRNWYFKCHWFGQQYESGFVRHGDFQFNQPEHDRTSRQCGLHYFHPKVSQSWSLKH